MAAALEHMDRREMARLKAALKPHEWRVVRLLQAGLSYSEISPRLGLNRSTVSMRVVRARRRLRRVDPELAEWLVVRRRRR